MGVEVSTVNAVLSVATATRRLGSDRRLQSTVNVVATIQADSADAVPGLTARADSTPVATMTTALNSALAASGVSVTVAVSSMDAVEGLPVDTPPSSMTSANQPRGKTSRGDTADTDTANSELDLPAASRSRQASASTIGMLGSMAALVSCTNFILILRV